MGTEEYLQYTKQKKTRQGPLNVGSKKTNANVVTELQGPEKVPKAKDNETKVNIIFYSTSSSKHSNKIECIQ